VLIFLLARGDGYPREIARHFGTALRGIQAQMERLEAGGVLSSRLAGRTLLYSFDPRYPFLPELKAFLERALPFLPAAERERLLPGRTRPRRAGKPA
jgi:hypothetical protein